MGVIAGAAEGFDESHRDAYADDAPLTASFGGTWNAPKKRSPRVWRPAVTVSDPSGALMPLHHLFGVRF